MAVEEVLGSAAGVVLPEAVASKLGLLVTIIQAIGGLIIIYIILMIIRMFWVRKQGKKIDQIVEDIEKIKKKLGIRK